MSATEPEDVAPHSPPAAAKPDRWALYRGLPTWQLVLALLPLGLVAAGGAVGGLIGAAAMLLNLKIARRQLRVLAKVAAMLGVVLGAVLVFLALAALLDQLLPD